MNNNDVKNVAKYLVCILSGVLIGTLCTFLINDKKIVYKTNSSNSKDKFAALYEAYDVLKSRYYIDLDDTKLIDGAIKGMYEATDDPHTVYMDKKEKEDFETELSGTYYGIGARIMQSEEDLFINTVFDDSPADKAGLKSGDKFVSIDGESTKGKTTEEVANYLKSDKSNKAVIEVERDGETLSITVMKSMVSLPTISSKMIDDNIGYVYVSIFGGETYEQFTKAVNDLEEKGMKSLIIDLRDNPGGYLLTVSNIMSDFLPRNKVIYQIKDSDRTEKYYATNNDSKDYKVIILVNNNSASASEIMSSTLKEQYGAILVGEKTYGKGTVQQTEEIKNGGLVKFTVEEWLTSEGKSINKVGVTPDYELDLSEDYLANPSDETDNQLQKALELLR